MKTKKLIVAIFTCFIGFLPFQTMAQVGAISFSSGASVSQNTTTPLGTVHRIYCKNEYTLVTHGLQMRSPSGAPTYGFYYDGFHKASTTVSVTQQWYYNTVNLPCTKGYIDLTIAGTATYYSYQTTFSLTNATTSGTYVQNQTTSLYNNFYASFSLPLTAGSNSSSSNMGTTTIISANDPLVSFSLLYFIFVLTLLVGVGVLYPLFMSRKRQ